MSVIVVDEKYRVLLPRGVRERLGISKGDRLLAIPLSGGILLLTLKGKRFAGYLKGFVYNEEEHEASRYLFGGRTECRS